MTAEAPQIEAKFVLAEGRAGMALAFLRQRCQPDKKYSSGTVSSLYFDTNDRRMLYEKLNSDFLKTKIRLRWYTELDGSIQTLGSFLEVKRRIGRVREKLRIAAPYEAAWLNTVPLHHPSLSAAHAELRPHGMSSPRLTPLFVVRYERYRFKDQASGARINLDRRIHVPSVNRDTAALRPGSPLPHAVLEIKGRTVDELPQALHAVLRLGCRLGSFSKYATCYVSVFGGTP